MIEIKYGFRLKAGMTKKMSTNNNIKRESILATANNLRWEVGENLHDTLIESIYSNASAIANKAVVFKDKKPTFTFDRTLDRILTSKYLGFPIMFLILGVLFWLTIEGANVPSGTLASFLVDTIHPVLKSFAASIGLPFWLDGVLIDGAYLAMAWVISVMLPPMAIFFPVFTLLEDFGYLPRVAFNMDPLYKRVGAHGKQALTMAMGFGCNAAGIIATRVIDSPRERLLAIITNNFSLCNGRWPTQILIATIFIGSAAPAYIAGLVSAAAVVFIAVLGIALSLIVSYALSKTMLKGEASAFSLELPPYRPPRILKTLYTSLIDRTIFVLWRAIVFAVPAGIVIWLVSNINIDGVSIANQFINWINPYAFIFGLNGVILLAYIIAIPANEIVIPTVLMLTVANLAMVGLGAGSGVMFELESVSDTAVILHSGGWTLLTGINLMLFSLLHNPCSTTIYTIYKETKSVKWTVVSSILPVIMGLAVTFFVTQVWRLIVS
jgi:ferrous iron transport protein B